MLSKKIIFILLILMLIGLIIGYNIGKGIKIPSCENIKPFSSGRDCQTIQEQIIKDSIMWKSFYGVVGGFLTGLLTIFILNKFKIILKLETILSTLK